MSQTFVGVRDVERAKKAIDNQSAMGRHTYVGVAPRVRQQGTADVVERVWCSWVDCDSRTSMERLESFQPQSSMIVNSGSGRHRYWQLSRALSPEHVRANRGLALGLGADRAATDVARVRSAPTTTNTTLRAWPWELT
jgi:hypothetical protein